MIAIMVRGRVPLVLGAWLMLSLVAPGAWSATLFGIVSGRSAAELAAGAAQFDAQFPGHRLILRTTAQVEEMDDAELERWWRVADAILLGAVFGDSVVPRLQRLASRWTGGDGRPLLAVNSDRQLLALTRLRGRQPLARLDKATVDKLVTNPDGGSDLAEHYAGLQKRFPEQAAWLAGHAYWNSRGSDNMARLVAWLLMEAGADVVVEAPAYQSALRYYRRGEVVEASELALNTGVPTVALLDTHVGDQAGNRYLLDALCGGLESAGIQCFAILARWGAATLQAVRSLRELPGQLTAVVSLQGFVVGGGDGREAATEAFARLGVPVLSAMRLNSRTEAEWRESSDGIPAREVHYRVGMPEYQGVSQPLVVAAAEPPRIDTLTGLRLSLTRPLAGQVERLVRRLDNWLALQRKANRDKRVAIIYYNHPPGRHNIGADNLDVPTSLWQILQRLRAEGYDTGSLPESPEALLALIQERGVNLPENGDALRRMAPHIAGMDSADYRAWFETLPSGTRTGITESWGEPPGEVMTLGDRLLVPGLQFGNIFMGPQPPRGWSADEEKLHADLSFPPPHQYLAFYRYLQRDFRADALVHLGRHSTYEFLPGHSLGLTEWDYPSLVAGDLPGIYPYIVDGVGEGLQAKRRGLAVIVDHLTPPLRTTPLYDELLQLRQLVESFEASAVPGSPARDKAEDEMRAKLAALDMSDEIAAEIAAESGVEAVDLERLDGELLAHEVGHYLTELQEAFMPHGLHVFGRDWTPQARAMMLDSMADKTADEDERKRWGRALSVSPSREMAGLLAALDGRFVAPGAGNDPIRSPDVLPTGRNFHGLNGSLLPTRVGYALGKELAEQARGDAGSDEGSEAVVLWASDTVRDEGAVVAFGMALLGVRPVWNSRGIVTGLERLPLQDQGRGLRERRDTLFTTSGLFRDLYSEVLLWLDKSVRLALQGSAATIARDYPALVPALDAALAPVAAFGRPGTEPLDRNRVAWHWVRDARAALERQVPPEDAGLRAAYRIFGDPPGSYGAGVNRLVERSGAWQDRAELADAYLNRMGHAYAGETRGGPARAEFERRLARVERSYLGRASHLYGLLDNNDAFDYLGGLSLAVEQVAGSAPDNRVINHANASRVRIDRLQSALLRELRGRYLNPAWIEPLMEHGYAGARTMGSEFLEYLWGWQVTNPDIIQSWTWDEVNAVYFQDRHDLGLDDFLGRGENAHVKANMLAILLVAAHKGFWTPDETTLDSVAADFARLVAANGLPGSGHTRPGHPMLAWIAPRLDEELKVGLEQAVSEAWGIPRLSDREAESALAAFRAGLEGKSAPPAGGDGLWLLPVFALLLAAGVWTGWRRQYRA